MTASLGQNELRSHWDIPDEIWLMIFSHDTDSADLRSLSLVCQRFSDFAQPLLFANVTFRAGYALLDEERGGIITWVSHFDYSNSAIANTSHRLQFISSLRIAPFVKSFTIYFVRTKGEDQIPTRVETGYGILDDLVTLVPQMESLERLSFLFCPISHFHLQTLHQSVLTRSRIVFSHCILLDLAPGYASISLRAVDIRCIITPEINHVSLLSAVWTQSLIELSIDSFSESTPLRQEIARWEPLNVLTTLKVDDISLQALSSHFHLFPNLRCLIVSGDWFAEPITIPSTLTELDILECSVGNLSPFSELSIRELRLSSSLALSFIRSREDIEAIIGPSAHLLSQISTLKLLNHMMVGYLMGTIIAHCQRLEHLNVVFGDPEVIFMGIRLPTLKDMTEGLFLHLDETGLPSTLKTMRFSVAESLIPEEMVEDLPLCDNRIFTELDTLNMSHFQSHLPQLLKITFSVGWSKTRLQNMPSEALHEFVYVPSKEGAAGKWRKCKRHTTA